MTISALDTKESYNGDGVTVAFDFDFKVDTTADLLVFTTALDGVETLLVLDEDYTVVLHENQNSNPGGTVTLSAAPGAGIPIVIMRGVDFARSAAFTGSVPPHVIESELDRLTMYAQQLREILERSLHVSAAFQVPPNVNLQNNVARAGKVVGFNDEGQAALYSVTGSSLVGPAGAMHAARVEFSAPAIFRQAADGTWSHAATTLTFIWAIDGVEAESRQLEVTIDTNTGEFNDPDLTEPGDDFTSELVGTQLLNLTSTYDGQRVYAQLAIAELPADDAFTSASFTPAWGSGEFTGGDPSGTVVYSVRSGSVSMYVEAARTATSDDGAMTWDAGSIPSAARPSAARTVECVLQYDDSTLVRGQVVIGSDGSATFSPHAVASALVTLGGTFQSGEAKGLPAGWSALYPL